MTKIEYWEDDETPGNTGWYICDYDSMEALQKKSPYDCVGPYDTKTEAIRIFHATNSAGDTLIEGSNERGDDNQKV